MKKEKQKTSKLLARFHAGNFLNIIELVAKVQLYSKLSRFDELQ
jgi:hypothetical protein